MAKDKEKKKENEKEIFVPIKGLLGEAIDYRYYEMKLKDRVIGFIIGFALAAFIMYIFFKVILVAVIAGVLAGIWWQKPYQNYLCNKRKKRLLDDFRSMLESLSTSYSSGKNTQNAFEDAYTDLVSICGEGASIVNEAEIILVGLRSNFNIEELLRNFADRSGLEDIASFAEVFEVSFRQGADISKIIDSTREIINDKISVELDIEASVASGKNELYVMLVMPIIVFMSLGSLGSGMSVVENTPINVIIKIIALCIFAGAYFLGKKILDIKV